MIREIFPLFGAPYCSDRQEKCVHDLNNEKPDCCIDSILRNGDAVPFLCLDTAYHQGYENCPHCLAKSEAALPESVSGQNASVGRGGGRES
jgi:hypothetical protein